MAAHGPEGARALAYHDSPHRVPSRDSEARVRQGAHWAREDAAAERRFARSFLAREVVRLQVRYDQHRPPGNPRGGRAKRRRREAKVRKSFYRAFKAGLRFRALKQREVAWVAWGSPP